jgi:hypothetical protein
MDQDDDGQKSDDTVRDSNPLVRSRLKKAECNSSGGRATTTLNLETLVRDAAKRQVVVNIGGTRRLMTTLQAAVEQVFHKAASGDMRAFKTAVELLRPIEEQAKQTGLDADYLSSEEVYEKLIQGEADFRESLRQIGIYEDVEAELAKRAAERELRRKPN